MHQAEALLQAARGIRERRTASRALDQATADHDAAQTNWNRHGQPAARTLHNQLRTAQNRVAQLETDHQFNQQWWAEHPDHTRRLQALRAELDTLNGHTHDPTPAAPAPEMDQEVPAEHGRAAEMRARLDQLQQRPGPDIADDFGL